MHNLIGIPLRIYKKKLPGNMYMLSKIPPIICRWYYSINYMKSLLFTAYSTIGAGVFFVTVQQ